MRLNIIIVLHAVHSYTLQLEQFCSFQKYAATAPSISPSFLLPPPADTSVLPIYTCQSRAYSSVNTQTCSSPRFCQQKSESHSLHQSYHRDTTVAPTASFTIAQFADPASRSTCSRGLANSSVTAAPSVSHQFLAIVRATTFSVLGHPSSVSPSFCHTHFRESFPLITCQ